MAHGLKDREGQIPTVPQFKFARRAITLNRDDDSRGHDASLPPAPYQNSRGQRAMRWGWVCRRPQPTFLARRVHRQQAGAHYFALCMLGLRIAGRVLQPLLQAATTHAGKSPHCRALGLGVREISVAAGTGADVMAGGAGAAGPTPDVRHQPPGYPDL